MVDELTQELFQTGSHYIYPISVYHCLKQSTGDRYHINAFLFTCLNINPEKEYRMRKLQKYFLMVQDLPKLE